MRLLIIGGVSSHLSEASKIAQSRSVKVTHVETPDKAIEVLREGSGANIVFCDISFSIKSFVTRLQQERISIPVLSCGIDASPSEAAKSIREGAADYIPLPPDADLIAAVLEAVTKNQKSLIFNDKVMEKTIALADKIAPSAASVLVTGESGTGKEVLAHYIHHKSKRAENPFVSVNCAAIPENLLESQLFGHEKGAFTGAVSRRVGKFEEANGGTLLLDEISEMDPKLQAKLLRAIQEKEIDRVGGGKPVAINIRLIATSNRNLIEEVKKGRFREDLYFRLSVVMLEVPPLRKRTADIKPLAKHFIQKYCEINDLPLKKLADSALEAIKKHDWPGNVREFENAMHRAVLLSESEVIAKDDLFIINDQSSDETDLPTNDESFVGRTVSEVEKDLILDTLDHCLGNRTHAANILGISIRTLRNKLKQYAQEEVTTLPNAYKRSTAYSSTI